ncbi:MAG TPA: ABC transporter permease, partial [Candidatus Sulfopaludibacter sp.]|nr:ABC transporter permease [Candidatus Sulfopaludibacter sp.]
MLVRDLLHALRGLRKSPAFALTACLTIALGIGASTAIFSVVNAVLLQPLPYSHPDRLALVESDLRTRNVSDFPLSPPDFDDIRRGATLFEDLAAVNTGRAVALQENAEPEQIRTGAVSPNFFRLLGAKLALGRDFTSADGAPPPLVPPGAQAQPIQVTAIISYDYWQRRFGGDPGLVGRGIEFGNGGRAQVAGVLAPGFELLLPPRKNTERVPDVWTALRVDYQNADRNGVFLYAIGRLKPGVSWQSARSQVDSIAADINRRFTIKQTSGFQLRVESMQDLLV